MTESAGKSRRWFVVLAWITLILFGIFVAGITTIAVLLPKMKKKQFGIGLSTEYRAGKRH